MKAGRQILVGSLLVLAIFTFGTTGYMLIEGWNLLDAVYMTAITVSTVGFGETNELSTAGRIFTMSLILVGVGTVIYILSTLTQVVVEGELREVLGRRTLQRRIRSLKGHYIICGFGRIGSQVASMLAEKRVEVVVVDNSHEVAEELQDSGIYFVQGSATEDESLLAAGIERAKGLVASVSSDADNVYIVLTAKGMKPDLFVIARATEPGSERKLTRAGADKVVSPYFIGARRIAQTVIRPSVSDFIDLTLHSTADMNLSMEQLEVGMGTELAGMELKDTGIRQKLDLIILAVRKANDQMIFNPQASTVIEVGDTLIALGRRDSMTKLGEILHSGV